MDSISSSSIIDIGKDDMHNVHCIDDYYIIEFSQEIPIMIELLSQTEAITQVSKGLFTEKINNKYLLVCREKLRAYIQQMFKFLFQFKNDYQSMKDNLRLLDLCNIVLLNASGNNTVFSLKKKLLLNNENINVDVIVSEYQFTQLNNIKNRKGNAAWDYRYFLIKHYGNILFDYYKNKDVQFKQVKIKGITDLINVDFTISHFIIHDLEYLQLINTNEKRNYHLWTYLNKMFNYCQRVDDKKAIFCFTCSLFINDFNDYSAYSFMVNFYKKTPFSFKEYTKLIQYLFQIAQVNHTESNQYYIQLCKLLSNQ